MAKKILIVDDNPADLEAVAAIVASAGYAVERATDGEKGVEAARALRPDLVIMDVVMPGINGFQACKMITRDPQTSSIPVVICSNKQQETDKAWGVKNGAKHYFVKPADPAELKAKLKELLG